jgi:FixJ family two-component response regulator
LPSNNPLIAMIDGAIAQLQLVRAEVERQDAARLRDQEGMIEAARRVARSDDMNSREVAEFLGISQRSVEKGIAGTECLFRARIRNGKRAAHLRQRVELHRRNLMDHGDCGDCDCISFTGLQVQTKAR